MANADSLISRSPSTTTPFSFTRTRSETRMWPKCMPKGLTQKWSWGLGAGALYRPRHSFAKTKLCEEPKSGGQPLLAVQAFLRHGRKGRWIRSLCDLNLSRKNSTWHGSPRYQEGHLILALREEFWKIGRRPLYGRFGERTRIQLSGRFCVQIDRCIR